MKERKSDREGKRVNMEMYRSEHVWGTKLRTWDKSGSHPIRLDLAI